MAVYKRFNGKKILPRDKNWNRGTWYILKRIKGHKAIHCAVPEAQTKEQAELAERREIEKLFNKRYGVEEDAPTFAHFVENTYRKYVMQHNVNIKAKEVYIDELKRFFGKKLLSDIKAQDCRDFQYNRLHTKTRLGGERSPSSVNREMSTLSKIFSLACEEGILERNPTQYVKSLKEPPPRKRLLTEKQQEDLWSVIAENQFLFRVVTLGLNLPLRSGQILGITKEAVDLENRILMATASKGRETRPVPLNLSACAILAEMCAEVSSGPIFLHRGKPVKSFGKRWRNALVKAGINEPGGSREDNYHVHDLRTWFSARLLRQSVHPKAIQGLFNHSDASISDIYINVDSLLEDAVNRLDNEPVHTSRTNIAPTHEIEGPVN